MKLPRFDSYYQISVFDIIAVKHHLFLSLIENMIKSILIYNKHNILHYVYLF